MAIETDADTRHIKITIVIAQAFDLSQLVKLMRRNLNINGYISSIRCVSTMFHGYLPGQISNLAVLQCS